MKTVKDIFEMLDLFYANKHLYQKIIKRQQKYEKSGEGVKNEQHFNQRNNHRRFATRDVDI